VDGARQNVTITLPRALLQRLRHEAVDAHLSLSEYLTRRLEDNSRLRYEVAQARQLALMEEGRALGFDHDKWNRNDLHDR